MLLHADRRSEDLFGGRQDGFHMVFYDLLANEMNGHDDRMPGGWQGDVLNDPAVWA
jgi:hypothetical protein